MLQQRALERGESIKSDLADYFAANPEEHMASVPTEVHVFRYRVVEAFLASGTPLERLPFFRELLEAGGRLSLTDVSHMREYIPKIESRELARVKDEFSECGYLTISFDGTSRQGEAMNLVGRFCTPSFCLKTRLLRFFTTKQHVNHQQLSALISRIILVEYRIDPERVVGISRDSVSMNGATCNLLTANPFIQADSIMCISHTLNNCGKRLQLEVADAFMTPWLELVGGRDPHRGAQALWKATVYPQTVPGFSTTRWHSKAEIFFVLAENFSRLPSFLARLDELQFGDATRKKLHAILDSEELRSKLKLELAAVLDLRSRS